MNPARTAPRTRGHLTLIPTPAATAPLTASPYDCLVAAGAIPPHPGYGTNPRSST